MKVAFTTVLLLHSLWCATSQETATAAAVDPLDIYRHYHVCDICPSEGDPTLESLGLPYEASVSKTSTLSCDEARALAEDGRYSPAACLLLRLRLHEDCGCGATGGGSPTFPAVADLTSTTPLEALNAKEHDEEEEESTNSTEVGTEVDPEAEPVLEESVVVSDPTKPVTESSKPVHQKDDDSAVTASSTVLLAPVPGGSLEDAHIVAFEGSMENFLAAKIRGVQGLACDITEQHVSASKLVSAVQVIVSCQGQSTSMSSSEFQELTNKVVAKDTPELLASLRENPDFIPNVATVFNFDDGVTVNASDDDVAEDNYVWITAGAFGVGGILILSVFLIIFIVKARELRMLKKPLPSANKRSFSFGQQKSNRLSKIPIPVAAAAAVAALVRESTDPEVKCLATKEEDGTTTETAASMSTLRRDMNCRTVRAPPGKLGIVIDTTLEGPVIHTVKPTSPIFGLVYPGDLVIAVNNEDTRAMSAVSLTDLMTRTSEVERELVVLSQDVVG